MSPEARKTRAKPKARQRRPVSAQSVPTKRNYTAAAQKDKTKGVLWACPLTPLSVPAIENFLLQNLVPFRKRACACLPSDSSPDYFQHESFWIGGPNGELHLETRFSLGAFHSGKEGTDRLKGPDLCKITKAMASFGAVMICPHMKLGGQTFPKRVRSCAFLGITYLWQDPAGRQDWKKWVPKEGLKGKEKLDEAERLRKEREWEQERRRVHECPCGHEVGEKRAFEKLKCPVEECETGVHFQFVKQDEPGTMEAEKPKLRKHPSVQIVITRKLGNISNLQESPTFWEQIVVQEDLGKDTCLLAQGWNNGRTFVEEYSKSLQEGRTRGMMRILDGEEEVDRSLTSKRRKLNTGMEQSSALARAKKDGSLRSWCFESQLTETSDWKEPPLGYENLLHVAYQRQTLMPPSPRLWVPRGKDDPYASSLRWGRTDLIGHVLDSVNATDGERGMKVMQLGMELRAKRR